MASDGQSWKRAMLEGAVIVGVDIAKKKHWARITDRLGQDLAPPFAFHNNRDGFWRLVLVRQIGQALRESGAQRAVVGMEATGHYGKPLQYFLRHLGPDWDVAVVLVNPMDVKRQKELLDNSPTKSDPKDTAVIAKLVRDGHFLHCLAPEGLYATLRELTVTRQHQRQELNGALNRLQGWLDMYFPEFPSVFKDVTGQAAGWVLSHYPTPAEVRSTALETLTEGLQQASKKRVGAKRAAGLKAAAEASVGIPDGLAGARLRLQGLLEEVAFWKGQLERTEAAMGRALQQTPYARFLRSIPGVGVVTAASFLGEIGEPTQYTDWRQIQKLAGLNLVENSSGQHQGRRTLSKRGRGSLRALLYRAALTMVAKNPVFRALYRWFVERPGRPLEKKQALVAVALKLLRVMFALMQKGVPYDPSRVLGEGRQAQLAEAA